jgi:hypothetical protein
MLRKTISVLSALSLAAVAGDEGDRLDTKVELFRDRNDVTAVSPVFLLTKGVGNHVSVEWEGQWDAVTGASRKMGRAVVGGGSQPGVDAVSGASLDGVSGASGKGDWESRYGSRVTGVYSNQGRVFSAGIYASRENDYQSVSPSVGGAWDFAERNTTLSWGASWFFDKSFPYGAWAQYGGGPKRVQSYNVGLTQILTPLSLFGVNATYTRTTGYIGHPYNPVTVAITDTPYDGLQAERLPSSKDAVALAGQFLQGFHLGERLGSASVEYRAYEDSWNLKSHTVTFKWTQHLTDATIFRLQGRWYRQWGAEFVKDAYQGDERYLTADIRFYPFSSYLAGAKLISEFPDAWPGWAPRRWDLSYDHLWRDTHGNVQLYQLYPANAWYMQGTGRLGLSWDL